MNLRNRARFGVLPGAITSEAAFRATLQVWIGVLVGTMLALTGAFILLIPFGANGGCTCVAYTQYETVRTSPNPKYDVLSTGGYHYLFVENPMLLPGAPFTVVFARDGHYRYAVVRGQQYVSTSTHTHPGAHSGAFRFLIIGEGLLLLATGALFVSLGIAAAKTRRAIRLDQGAPLQTVHGHYEGSRLSRMALATRGRAVAPFARSGQAGFPLFVTTAAGDTMWFAGPLDRAEDVKAFETALRSTERLVDVHYHPHTRVVTSIHSASGTELDLTRRQDIDVFDPSVGLPLKGWHRRVR